MIVVVDANVLVTWSSKKASTEDDRARLEFLFEQVSNSGGRIVIPTPSLAEFLVKTDEATSDWLVALEKKKAIRVAPVDRRAAFECALLDKAAIGAGDKKAGRSDAWQKIKIDRQIIAVARAQNASTVVSDDRGLRTSAQSAALIALAVVELELPASARQIRFPFGGQKPD